MSTASISLDDLEVDPGHRAGRRIQYALDRVHDVLGIELAAVMEFHALAELEGPRLEVVAAVQLSARSGLSLPSSWISVTPL